MSIGPTRGPVQRPGIERDLAELFQRTEDLERVQPRTRGSIIAGTIEGGTGDVLNGTGGFTCSAQAGDDYTVTFDTPLAAPPVVIAQHGGGASIVVDPTTTVPAWGVSETGFSVTSLDADDWSFIAILTA